ncbi:MAG: polysaccharide deacetylase family protein [Promethearchaeota archaeon]
MANLIGRMNRVFDKYDVKMTYFISTYLIADHPSFFEHFEDHDFGPHGHLHLDYSLVGKRTAFQDMKNSILIFKKLNLNPWIFRAPYGVTKIEKSDNLFFEYENTLGIRHDSSINLGGRPLNQPPYIIKHKCGVTSIPFVGVADDYLIDNLALNDNNEILHRFAKVFDYCRTGILVYDMHPIRMGQARYIEILEALIKQMIKEKNSIIMSLKEAFSRFDKKDEDETIVCFTGDIDNLSILDYFKRFKTW